MIPGCCFSHRFISISRIRVGEIIKDPMNSAAQRSAYSEAAVSRTFAEREFVTVENKSFFNLSVTDESLLRRSLWFSITTKHQQWLHKQIWQIAGYRNLAKFAWNWNARLLIWFAFPKWNGIFIGKDDNNESQIICILCILCAPSRKNFHFEFNDFSDEVRLCCLEKAERGKCFCRIFKVVSFEFKNFNGFFY